jgi:hypothetical protein
VDVGAVVMGLLKSKKEKIQLETPVFLRDTFIGRPVQNVQASGGVLHAHTVWRPLAKLSDEEVQLLDSITKKPTAPAGSNTSPDTTQNQIESKLEQVRGQSATRHDAQVLRRYPPSVSARQFRRPCEVDLPLGSTVR